MNTDIIAAALAEHVRAIAELGRQTVKNVVEIGRRLSECRTLLKEDQCWREWLKSELRLSPQTAGRFIQVYELSGDVPRLEHLDLPVSGLYLLAAPSTPDKARDELIERAQAGETVPVAEVKRTIERAKGRKQSSSKRKPTTKPQAGTKSKHDAADDIGPNGTHEAERLRVRVEELQAQVRQRDIKITALESEIEEAKAAPERKLTRLAELENKTRTQEITIEGLRRDIAELQKTSGDPMSVSEFQAAIRKWEDTVETQKNIIRHLQNENATLRAVAEQERAR